MKSYYDSKYLLSLLALLMVINSHAWALPDIQSPPPRCEHSTHSLDHQGMQDDVNHDMSDQKQHHCCHGDVLAQTCQNIGDCRPNHPCGQGGIHLLALAPTQNFLPLASAGDPPLTRPPSLTGVSLIPELRPPKS